MTTPSKPIVNLVLASLPEAEYQRISAHLEPVELPFGKVLNEIDDPIDYAYFPSLSIISLIQSTAVGQNVEVGLLGKEGMMGLPILSGVTRSPYRAIVQGAGEAMRMKATHLQAEFREGGALQQKLLNYMHALMMQISRTAVCNRVHQIEGRLARWLLMTADRMQSNHLQLTHEFMADMLGTGRVGVTLAAGALQKAGMIEYSRGKVTILNREGVEMVACECYELVKEEFNQVGLGV
jgi:CRP-like cAMP-binding protein